MDEKERKLLAEGQEAMRNVYGQFKTEVSCEDPRNPEKRKATAKVELHRSPDTNSISASVEKCRYAEKKGGHGGQFCTRSKKWCIFSFDYPYVAEGSDSTLFPDPPDIYWKPPEPIKLLLIAMISLFGIKEKGRLWS